jgi:hypothetical protein
LAVLVRQLWSLGLVTSRYPWRPASMLCTLSANAAVVKQVR